MATAAAVQAELCRLRRDIARIEGRLAEADRMALDAALPDASVEDGDGAAAGASAIAGHHGTAHELRPRKRRGRLRLGLAALDRILGGGLPLATLHEIRARASRDGGAAAGFALALISRLAEAGGAPSVVWISEAGVCRETGGLYAPGLAALGLDPGRIVHVAARTETEALWAFEAALACRGLGAAICELRQASLDLSATRRCALRAREAEVTGFLLRLSSKPEPSAAELRFRLAPAPAATVGGFARGVGRMAWNLTLEKNRGGRTGVFTVEWNGHERCFAGQEAERGEGERGAHPQPVLAAPADGPPHPAQEGGAGGCVAAGCRRAS